MYRNLWFDLFYLIFFIISYVVRIRDIDIIWQCKVRLLWWSVLIVFTYSNRWAWKKMKVNITQRTATPQRSRTSAPLLLRERLHPPCWRTSWGLPLLVPEFSSPSLPMLKLSKRLASSVVLHQFLSLRTLSAGGEIKRWCIPCISSWASNTSVFWPPVSLQKRLLYCRGYCDCPTEHTHTRACRPAPVLTQELAYSISIHQLWTGK